MLSQMHFVLRTDVEFPTQSLKLLDGDVVLDRYNVEQAATASGWLMNSESASYVSSYGEVMQGGIQ